MPKSSKSLKTQKQIEEKEFLALTLTLKKRVDAINDEKIILREKMLHASFRMADDSREIYLKAYDKYITNLRELCVSLVKNIKNREHFLVFARKQQPQFIKDLSVLVGNYWKNDLSRFEALLGFKFISRKVLKSKIAVETSMYESGILGQSIGSIVNSYLGVPKLDDFLWLRDLYKGDLRPGKTRIDCNELAQTHKSRLLLEFEQDQAKSEAKSKSKSKSEVKIKR